MVFQSENIENVLLYVADSVRYDYFDQNLIEGTLFKTVAQSHTTWPVLSTLATGLRPQQHGIQTYTDRLLRDVESLFDIEDINGSYYGYDNSHILKMIRAENTELEDIEPPFFYLERDNGPHMPYQEEWQYDSQGYYTSRLGDPYHLQQDYKQSIQRSVEKFKQRIETLTQRGLLEDTLVIFTSDHGEHLGEHGCYGHNAPSTPSVTYVPTVFSHDSLANSMFGPDPQQEVIEHVDITETVSATLGTDQFQTSGVDLFDEDWSPKPGYTYKKSQKDGRTFYEAEGLWWYDGGHTFVRNSRLSRLVYAIYMMSKSAGKRQMRRNALNVVETFLSNGNSYGSPPMSRTEAAEMIEVIVADMENRDSEDQSLNEQQRERLEDLGYWM